VNREKLEELAPLVQFLKSGPRDEASKHAERLS